MPSTTALKNPEVFIIKVRWAGPVWLSCPTSLIHFNLVEIQFTKKFKLIKTKT